MKIILAAIIISVITLTACKKDFTPDDSLAQKSTAEDQLADENNSPLILAAEGKAFNVINATNGIITRSKEQFLYNVPYTTLTQTPLLINDKLLVFLQQSVMALDYHSEKVLWATKLTNKSGYSWDFGATYPCIANNRLFFTNRVKSQITLFSINLANGNIEWSHNLQTMYLGGVEETFIKFSSAYGNNTVIATSFDTLYAFNSSTGQELWKLNPTKYSAGKIQNPSVYGSTVYFVVNNSSIYRDSAYAVDLETGKLKWKTDVNELADNPAPLCDGAHLFINKDRGVICLNPLTGNSIWNYENKQYNFAPMFLDKGKLFVTSDVYADTRLYALNPDTGTPIWQIRVVNYDEWNWRGPIVMNNIVYVFGNNAIDAYAAPDGKYLWSTKMWAVSYNQFWAPVLLQRTGELVFSSATGMY